MCVRVCVRVRACVHVCVRVCALLTVFDINNINFRFLDNLEIFVNRPRQSQIHRKYSSVSVAKTLLKLEGMILVGIQMRDCNKYRIKCHIPYVSTG